MNQDQLKILFKLKKYSIFDKINKNGGPIISKILNKLSNWKKTPQIFIQYNNNLSYEQNFRARIITTDSELNPLIGAKISIQEIDEDENLVRIYNSIITSEEGEIIDIEIEFLDKNTEDADLFKNIILVIEYKNEIRKVPLSLQQLTRGEYGIYIFTDRLIYKPGQRVYAKIFAWQIIDGIYKINQSEVLRLSLYTGSGRKIFIKKLRLNEFGTVDIDLPLSRELEEGKYYIEAKIGNSRKQLPIKIEYFKKPVIDLKVDLYPNYLLMGSSIEVDLEARYFWDELVTDGEIKITLVDENNQKISYLKANTDYNGRWRGLLDIPPNLKSSKGTLIITIKDKFEREDSKEVELVFSPKDFYFTIKKTIFKSGEINTIPIELVRPDDIPLENCKVFAALNLNGISLYDRSISDNRGIAYLSFNIPPLEESLNTQIVYEFLFGSRRECIVKNITILPTIESDLEETIEKLLTLEVDRELVQIGETINIKIESETNSPTYLIIKKDDLLKYEQLPVNKLTNYELKVDRRYWGKIRVEAFSFTNEGDLAKSETEFTVGLENKPLKVSITGFKENYRPGEKAGIEIEVFQDDKPVKSSLHAALIDKSVLELGGSQEDPIKCLFDKQILNKEIKTYFSWDRALFVNDIGELLELLNYLAYLNKDLILSIIYLISNIEKRELIDPNTIKSCLKILIDAINRHSNNNTPLWLYFTDDDSFIDELKFKLFDYIFLKYLEYGDEIANLSTILNELIDKKDTKQIQNNYLSVFERIAKICITNYPQLRIFYPILNFNDHYIKETDPGLAENIENLILRDLEQNPLKSMLNSEELQKAAIIFRLGSRILITGFEGMVEPMDASWCIIGYPKYTSIMTDVEHYQREYYEGESIGGGDRTTMMALLQSDDSPKMDDGLVPIEEELPILGKIRKSFPETALWLSDFLYDSKKPYHISFEMPDTIGQQELILIGSTKDCEIGISKRECFITQDFFIKVNLPNKINLGEEIVFQTLLTNNYDVDLICNIELESNYMEINSIESGENNIEVTVPRNSTISNEWVGKPIKIGNSILKMRAKSKQYIDTVEYPIEIFPPGLPFIESYTTQVSDKINGEFRINYDNIPVARDLSLSIIPDGITGALQGVERLINYSHDCNEQISSAIIASSLAIQYLNRTDKINASIINEAEDKIASGLQLLLSRRNSKNTWSWYHEEETNLEITLQVLEAFIEASKIGYDLETDILIPSCDSVLQEINDQIVNMPYKSYTPIKLVAKAYLILKNIISEKKLTNLLKFLKENVSRISDPYELANICYALNMAGIDVSNHLKWLENRSKEENGLKNWESKSTLVDNIGCTAAVIRLLAFTEWNNDLLSRSKNWILKQWDGDLGYGSTSKNLEVIRSLLSIPEVLSNYEIEIKLNDNVIKRFSISPDNYEEQIFDLRHIKIPQISNDSLVSISIRSDKKDFLSIVNLLDKKWYLPDQDMQRESSNISISKNYTNIHPQLNEPIQCELELIVREKQLIVVIEDNLPSGFILDEDSIADEGVDYSIAANKIKFYLCDFDGESKFSYNIIPILSGKVFSSGAIAYSMYNEREFVSWTPATIFKIGGK
jgi:hypothetical protein